MMFSENRYPLFGIMLSRDPAIERESRRVRAMLAQAPQVVSPLVAALSKSPMRPKQS